MFESISQYTYQVGPWNQTNSLIVPLWTWNDMQFQFNMVFYTAAALGVVLLILGIAIFFTPASSIMGARMSGGKALLNFRRDGTWQIKGLKNKRGFLFSKDAIHQVLPGSMHYNKGLQMGVCWEESGTAMPVEMAAAMGLLAKTGIPDAETLELFNFYLRFPDQFNTLLSDDTQAMNFELLPLADSSGTFYELVKHAKEVYSITDSEPLRKKFSEIRKHIPKIEDPKQAQKFKAWRFPYWWNETRGLVANVSGNMLSWSEIKNYQIYHQNPSAFIDIVDDESSRKARKAPKQNATLIIVAGVVICGVIIVGIIAMKYLGVF
jgi:hypothetical protein